MSLVHFVETPVLRDAFKQATRKDFERPDVSSAPILAKAVGSPVTAGSAFDYLARFRLARQARERGRHARQFKLISERSIDVLGRHHSARNHHAKYVSHMRVAKDLVGRWIEGDDALYGRVLDVAQWMARLDVWYRTGTYELTRRFWIDPKVRDDMRALDEVLVSVDPFADAVDLFLNPSFVGGTVLNGADADVVADHVGVDFKTSGESSFKINYLRQLVGYAVVNDQGGIDLGDGGVHERRITHVAVYFCRHGAMGLVDLDALFVPGGREAYAEVFRAEAAKIAGRPHPSDRPSGLP